MAEKVERLILIAEDDQNILASWENDVREFNRDAKAAVRFHAVFAKTQVEALSALRRFRINCAVIDLRLPVNEKSTEPSSEATGNAILEQVLLETGVPAVVYSGFPGEASDKVRASRINVMQKKGGGTMEALQWLAKHEGLMYAMSHMRHQVEREAAGIFSRSIWPRWEDAWNAIADGPTLAGIITRQVVAHVSEVLSLPPTFHHPEEFYFVPALSEMLSTGDMVKYQNAVYVVVTPRCNMAHGYPKHIMLGLCASMADRWKNLKKRFATEKDMEGAEIELRNLATQGEAIATHFLPPSAKEGPWLVQFKNIMTVPASEAANLIAGRFASVAPQFVPNLVQRYAAYLGRIGQPDLDQKVLRDQICK